MDGSLPNQLQAGTNPKAACAFEHRAEVLSPARDNEHMRIEHADRHRRERGNGGNGGRRGTASSRKLPIVLPKNMINRDPGPQSSKAKAGNRSNVATQPLIRRNGYSTKSCIGKY